MPYINFVEVSGFSFGVGRACYDKGYSKFPMQITLDLEDLKIIDAIRQSDPVFLSALKDISNLAEEIDAVHEFKFFNENAMHGNKWSTFLNHVSFDTLEKYKRQAVIVLESTLCNDQAKKNASIYLEALKGNVPEYIPTENDLITRKENKFRDSRAKWLKLLIERDGYQCNFCKSDKNLCIKHTVSLRNKGETELSNLKLFCRSCMRKAK